MFTIEPLVTTADARGRPRRLWLIRSPAGEVVRVILSLSELLSARWLPERGVTPNEFAAWESSATLDGPVQ